MTDTSFFRRPLPEALIPFSGPEGRALFAEALAAGTLEGWFPLAEQFNTQADPATCGLGSLVVALNALQVDPGRTWKGPWRWFGEEQLDCCVPIEVVRERGISLGELGCLARCNGARAAVRRADQHGVDAFREDLASASRTSAGPFVVASYDRRVLGQTGIGHFSPIAAWHEGRDLALILDVARFKYPPHWAPVPLLHAAMNTLDADTGSSRGWLLLDRDPRGGPNLLQLTLGGGAWTGARRDLTALRAWFDSPGDSSQPHDLPGFVQAALGVDDLIARAAALRAADDPRLQPLLAALRATETWRQVEAAGAGARVDAITLLALALQRTPVDGPLGEELTAVRAQIDALCPPPER